MLQEPFAIGNSFVHRRDPRIRLLAACLYSVTVAISNTFQVLAAAMTVSFILMALARLPLGTVAKRIVLLNGFIVLLWLIIPLTFEGTVSYPIGPFTVYHRGIVLAALITLKSNAILLVIIALVATMNFSTLGFALYWLRVPNKLVYMMLMTYRYVFVINHELQRMLRAIKIRGFRPRTNLHTYKTYAYLMGMLLVRSSHRAERVYKAMICRGFKHKFYCLYEFEADRKDWMFGAVMGGIVLAMACLEWFYN